MPSTQVQCARCDRLWGVGSFVGIGEIAPRLGQARIAIKVGSSPPRPVSFSAAGGVIALIIVVNAVAVRPAWAHSQACCNLSSVNRACFEDDLDADTSAIFDTSSTGLRAGTTCVEDHSYASTNNACVLKQAGSMAHVEIQPVSAEFNRTDTKFTYRVPNRPDSAHGRSDSRLARADAAWAGLGVQEMELCK